MLKRDLGEIVRAETISVIKGSEYDLHLPFGAMAWVRFHADSGRTVIILTKKTRVEMIRQVGDERFIMFWHASLVGGIVGRKQGVEKTMEFASAYEADIANLHGPI
jgi:hypothetical protein